MGEGVREGRTKARGTGCLRRRDTGKYPRLLGPGRDAATPPWRADVGQVERIQLDRRSAVHGRESRPGALYAVPVAQGQGRALAV